jgi:glyoxylase-like metal-dependent hydrolase (beta-lactamase superfamily II)
MGDGRALTRARARLAGACIAALAVVLGGAAREGATGAGAQTRPAAPSTVRMYVFDAGVLRIADPKPLFGLGKEQVAASDLADGAYLIVHPKGTLMWEAGLVPDGAIGGPNARPGAPTTKLKDAMAAIGYRPSDITYLALSHGHGDHTANANDFAASTWLVHKAEFDAMFGEKVPRFYTPATYAALKNSKVTFVTGDHDVFGDGTVVVRQTPGHTPGHQVLIVKLAKTGVVVLPGDLYHYPEEIPMRTVAPAQGDEAQTLAARDALQAYLKQVKGQMWITHDLIGFGKLKKSPEFYD